MRLLFVSHSLPPANRPMSNVGGMQRVASELLRALHSHPQVALSTQLLRSSWKWTHVKAPFFLATTALRLYRTAREQSVDRILFSSMVTASLAVPLKWHFSKNGIETAVIAHGRDVTLPFPPYQLFVPQVFKALDHIFPVSMATAAACRLRGAQPEQVTTIPNGVDLSRFDASPREQSAKRELLKSHFGPLNGLSEEGLLLCSVGRQVERKGFTWFIQNVMPRLPDSVHYWLAGDGPESEEITRTINRKNLRPRVRWLGRISEERLEALYRGADVFVMPNIPVEGDMEGFGVVMLEAAQTGLPTIASRLEGIRDVIEEAKNGHLVRPGDPDAFADAIMHFHANPAALQQASKKAESYVEQNYGWDSIAERYVQALK